MKDSLRITIASKNILKYCNGYQNANCNNDVIKTIKHGQKLKKRSKRRSYRYYESEHEREYERKYTKVVYGNSRRFTNGQIVGISIGALFGFLILKCICCWLLLQKMIKLIVSWPYDSSLMILIDRESKFRECIPTDYDQWNFDFSKKRNLTLRYQISKM